MQVYRSLNGVLLLMFIMLILSYSGCGENVSSNNSSRFSLIPFPGSWAWEGYGGGITQNPQIFLSGMGFETGPEWHVFVRGNDNALWCNYRGSWYSLGGSISSDVCIYEDYYQDKLHVFAKGSSSNLVDCVINFNHKPPLSYNWFDLGGTILSAPTAAPDPVLQHHVIIAVRYSDNALWINDLNTLDMSSSWKKLGGYLGGNITLNPHIIERDSRTMITYVRGNDGSLWFNTAKWNNAAGNYDYSWENLDSQITSDPVPHIYYGIFARGENGSLKMLEDPFYDPIWVDLGGFIQGNPFPVLDDNGFLHVYVRGGDNALWDNVIDTHSSSISARWYGLGGVITSDPSSALAYTSEGPQLWAATRGGDGALWINKIE